MNPCASPSFRDKQQFNNFIVNSDLITFSPKYEKKQNLRWNISFTPFPTYPDLLELQP